MQGVPLTLIIGLCPEREGKTREEALSRCQRESVCQFACRLATRPRSKVGEERRRLRESSRCSDSEVRTIPPSLLPTQSSFEGESILSFKVVLIGF